MEVDDDDVDDSFNKEDEFEEERHGDGNDDGTGGCHDNQVTDSGGCDWNGGASIVSKVCVTNVRRSSSSDGAPM